MVEVVVEGVAQGPDQVRELDQALGPDQVQGPDQVREQDRA